MRATTIKLICAQHSIKSFAGVILIHLQIQGGNHFSDEGTEKLSSLPKVICIKGRISTEMFWATESSVEGYAACPRLPFPLSDLNSHCLVDLCAADLVPGPGEGLFLGGYCFGFSATAQPELHRSQ